MYTKRIIRLSLITLPVSVLIFLFFNLMLSTVAGGLGTTRGFPIPYYYNKWDTPVEFYQPLLIVADILIIYLVVTPAFYLIKRNKNKQ